MNPQSQPLVTSPAGIPIVADAALCARHEGLQRRMVEKFGMSGGVNRQRPHGVECGPTALSVPFVHWRPLYSSQRMPLLRCLLPQKKDGLIVSGRAMSVTTTPNTSLTPTFLKGARPC